MRSTRARGVIWAGDAGGSRPFLVCCCADRLRRRRLVYEPLVARARGKLRCGRKISVGGAGGQKFRFGREKRTERCYEGVRTNGF